MRKSIFVVLITVAVLWLLFMLLTLYNTRSIIPRIVQNYSKIDSLYLSPDSLSNRQQEILLSVVDPYFFQHNGVSGGKEQVKSDNLSITRRLTDYYFPDAFAPRLHNWKQNFIARYAFHAKASKKEQLNVFINEVNLGRYSKGVVRGLKHGSNFYHNKDFSELTDMEYIDLLAMIANPTKYNMLTQRAAHAERVESHRSFLHGKIGGLEAVEVTEEATISEED